MSPRCLLYVLPASSCDARAPGPSIFLAPVAPDPRGQLDVQRCLFNLHRRRFVLNMPASGRHGQKNAGFFQSTSSAARPKSTWTRVCATTMRPR